MKDRIALIVDNYHFSVRRTDQFGEQTSVATSADLMECLILASQVLGHPLVIPISGPNTNL